METDIMKHPVHLNTHKQVLVFLSYEIARYNQMLGSAIKTVGRNTWLSPLLYLVYLYGLFPLFSHNAFVGDTLIGCRKVQFDMICNTQSSDVYER